MRKRIIPRLQGLPAAWQPLLRAKARPPVLIVLGSPKLAADLVEQIGLEAPTLFQLDVYQAEAVRAELAARNLTGDVVTLADIWDLPAQFQTVIYPVELGGERMLKLDVIEQVFHVMQPGANLVVLSPYERDPFFPPALKKLYGKVHAPETGKATLLWCQRSTDRAKRRHEVTFQVRHSEELSVRFVSRPGVFSYGRFDNGARALVDVAEVKPHELILDLGCGVGTNGILCALHAGPGAKVTFVDSNCRATALASLNATTNGLTNFRTVTAWQLDELPRKSFDLVLANPPYYANLTIAKRFIDEAAPTLKRRGRMYVVTKQPDEVASMMARHLGPIDAVEHRGYNILSGTAPTR